jgi:hypothetical protein
MRKSKTTILGLFILTLLSSCSKDQDIVPSTSSQQPRLTVNMPTCNWTSGSMVAVETYEIENGTRYRYVTDNFSAVIDVKNRQINQFTGSVTFYTYYVDLPTLTIHLCNSGGSYPVTYTLTY